MVTDDSAAEFDRLFWEAWEAHRKLKKKPVANNPEHKAAQAFAKSRAWSWAGSLLEACRLYWADENEKALKLLNECAPQVPERWRTVFDFVRGGALRVTKDYDAAIESFKRVLTDPNFDRPGFAWNSLGLALKGKGNFDEAIKAYHQALNAPKFDSPGATWFNIGLAHYEKGEPAEAIKAYQKAFEDPKYDDLGSLWNNLGNALKDAGRESEALEAYRKANSDPNYSSGYSWYNLGLALNEKGKSAEAIEAYRKALASSKFDRPGYAWNNLGLALSAIGKHGEAIKAYLKAIDDPNYDTPAKAWLNLGQLYLDVGKRKEAENALKKAMSSPDPQGGEHAKARATLLFLRANMRTVALSPDDLALAEKSLSRPASGPSFGPATEAIESGIIGSISEAGDTQYEKYLAKPDSTRSDTLSILRGWSSAVTLLEGSERRWRGGGYFLKWRGYGVAIDPGFDFLRNFHDAGYHGREIDAVVVSHNHPDHNFDLKALDDLRYELFKRLRAIWVLT